MQKRTQPKQWTRRDFLRMSAGVTGVAVLSACVPAGPPGAQQSSAPAGEGPVTVDVWTGWTEDAATNIEKILDGFNKSQDQVVAKHVIVPEAMTQKLLAAVSAGNPPAAAVVFGANIAYQLAAQKALMALDEVGNPEQVDTLKQWMDPAIWDLGIYDGKYYYASMWNQCMGCYVNVKMATEMGIDVNSPPQTLEELDAAWEQMTTYDADGNIDVLGGDFNWAAMVMGRYLGQWVSEDGAQVTANHPNNVKALEWVVNRWAKIGPEKISAWNASLAGRGERSAGQDPFLSGLRATLVTGPWHYNTLRNFKPDDFEFAVWPLPGPANQTEKGMYTYGDGWIIPVGAPNPSAAWEIISAMTGATGNRDVYTSLFTTWLCVNGPSSKTMTEWPLFQTDVIGACDGYEEVFLADLYDSDYYLYPPKIPTSTSYMDLMGAEWEKARLGQKSAQEALDFVQETAQKELDTWLQQNQG